MMYTVENLEAMGSVYAQLTQLKGFNDPFQGQCDMFPMRSITTMIKRTMPYISDELNQEIGELMDTLDANEIDELINKPVPMTLRMSFWTGYNKKVWLFGKGDDIMKKRLLYCYTNAYDMLVSIDEEDNCRYLINNGDFPSTEDRENGNKVIDFLQSVEDDSSWEDDCSKEELLEDETTIIIAEIEKEL